MNYDQTVNFKNQLKAAYSLLPEPIIEPDCGFTKDVFNGYLQLNEYLLAMEELDSVIEDNPDPGVEFWNHLITAAKILGHVSSLNRYEHITSLTL